MKRFHKTIAAGVIALGLTAASMVSVSAAPQLSLTVSGCTITKEGGNYHFVVSGSYTAANNNDNSYKINGYRFVLRNNGGQNLRDTGLVAIAPTYLWGGNPWDEMVGYKFASSLKDVQFYVFNGGSQKGYDRANCQRVGWN